jgi:probable HAF family extracellular repeat protein
MSFLANGERHAFITSINGQMIDLGTLGGSYSIGNGINASGQVTGVAQSPLGYHAFVTNNGVMGDLGVLTLAGNGINDSGQVTGTDSYSKAFVTNSSGQMVSLGTLTNGGLGFGAAINAYGQVVGGSQVSNGSYHAFITNSNEQMVDLGTLGGSRSAGFGVNSSGQVTGYAATASGDNHAFITSLNGQMTDFGTLGGVWGEGNGINDLGQVVGRSLTTNGSIHAFVTDNGVMRDINSLLSSNIGNLVLTDATSINDAGQITGYAVNANGLFSVFLLTPVSAVPVPGAVWLFASGLGLLAFSPRRKTQNIQLQYC